MLFQLVTSTSAKQISEESFVFRIQSVTFWNSVGHIKTMRILDFRFVIIYLDFFVPPFAFRLKCLSTLSE